MKTSKKLYITPIVVCILAVLAGCAPLGLTVDDRSMTIDDVIALTTADLDADIIIGEIEATYSKFWLDTDDILRLKKAGVDNEVIECIIKTRREPERFAWEYRDSPYNASFYGFNGSGFYTDPYYGPPLGISPFPTPYDFPVNNQTDFIRQMSPGGMIYDMQMFQNDSRKRRIQIRD